jgi:hypothetical protein
MPCRDETKTAVRRYVDGLEVSMRTALFVTSLADALFPQAAIVTVRLLERLRRTVIVPAAQSCCQQMHTNWSSMTRTIGPLLLKVSDMAEESSRLVV